MTTSLDWFDDRQAALGTRHRKEEVIAWPMRDNLSIDLFVTPDFDSDQSEALNGELPRAGTQLEAARAKAKAAIDTLGLDLGIANEGSFGNHLSIPLHPETWKSSSRLTA